MNAKKTEAFLLRAIAFKESSLIVSFLTPMGRIDAIAKGARRKKNKLSAVLQKINLLEIVYLGKSQDSLLTLADATVIEQYSEILTDYEKLVMVHIMSEICYDFAKFNDAQKTLFDDYRSVLEIIASLPSAHSSLFSVLLWFLLRLLKNEGHLPHLSFECQHCGNTKGDYLYLTPAYGFLCDRCFEHLRPVEQTAASALTRGDFRALTYLFKNDAISAARLKIDRRIVEIWLDYVENLMEKRIKARELLNASGN